MRQAGIVDSVRGREGGHRLRGAPEDLSVGEVIRAIQGPMSAIDCAEADGDGVPGNGQKCPLRPGCVLLPMWDKAHRAMMDVYDETTFGDLVEQERAANGCKAVDYVI